MHAMAAARLKHCRKARHGHSLGMATAAKSATNLRRHRGSGTSRLAAPLVAHHTRPSPRSSARARGGVWPWVWLHPWCPPMAFADTIVSASQAELEMTLPDGYRRPMRATAAQAMCSAGYAVRAAREALPGRLLPPHPWAAMRPRGKHRWPSGGPHCLPRHGWR